MNVRANIRSPWESLASRIRSAATLEELSRRFAEALQPLDIDHAILIGVRTPGTPARFPAHSLYLPFSPVSAAFDDAIRNAINQDRHPVANLTGEESTPESLEWLVWDTRLEPIIEQLMRVYRDEGLRYVYEIPLTSSRGLNFALEVARSYYPVSPDELLAMQALAGPIPEMLPDFVVAPFQTRAIDDDIYRVV